MHVINADTNIPFDGLLGDDFFRGQEAKIDYSNSSISTKSFPFPIPVHRNTPQFPKSTLMLNPRTEMVSSIKIINPQNLKEGIVVSQQLGADNSILIPNAVVKVRNDNTAITTLINTSVTKQTIPCPELHIIPLPEQAYINKITTGNGSKIQPRSKLLDENLRLTHLNDEEVVSVRDICHEFHDIFHLPNDELTQTTSITHDIPTLDEKPTHTKSYRYPQVHKDEVRKQVDKMLKQGIIKPSTSPWSSPLWVVPKKLDASGERKWRVVIDYRRLNEKTIGDAYPLPNIEDILDQLGRINSNADGLSRLLPESDVTHINLTSTQEQNYNDFVKFHYLNQNTIVYEKENAPLGKIKDPIVILWSMDSDQSNEYSEYLNSNFDLSKLKPTLNNVSKLENKNQKCYLLHPTNFHFDKLEYKNLFESFKNFKKIIKEKNFVLVLPTKHTNIKPSQLYEMLEFIFPSNKIKIYNTTKTTPKNQDEIKKILIDNHDSKLSGHPGFHKTYRRIKDTYYWPSMKADIRKYVKNCQSCQINKTNFKPTRQPMEITSTSDKPFDRLAIDVVGPLPITEEGNRFIITAQDDLTKYSFATPVPNHESKTIAKTLTHIFTYFGIPKTILSDQGPDFMSQLIKDLSTLFKTHHISTTPYHPQTNGALERSHLTLKDYLKHYIKPSQTDWDEFIPFAMFSYNTSTHASTNYTPYELLFGHKAYLPSSITQEPVFRYTYDDYIQSLQNRLNISFKIAKENLINSKQRSKHYYDKRSNATEFKATGSAQKSNHVSFHCERTLELIKQRLTEIKTKDEILNHLSVKESHTRKRRGLIDGASYALKWLIGTPDADDANYYSGSINTLLEDNKQTQTLLKSQVQIISNTIQNFNNSVILLKQGEQQMNDNFHKISMLSNTLVDEVHQLKLETTITDQVTLLSTLSSKILDDYNEFIDAINLGKHNILSPRVITPKILFDELIKYKGESDLPIEPTPQNHENQTTFSYIEPNDDYLLISQAKTSFSYLQDLSSCEEYTHRHFICNDVFTSRRNDASTCELQLLSPHVKLIPSNCRTRNINAAFETWEYINNNQWLYVLHRPTTLTLVCEENKDGIEDVPLHNTGLIQLKGRCKGYTDTYVLQTSNQYFTDITHIVPQISITDDDCCLLSNETKKQAKLHLPAINFGNVDLSELKYASKKLNELDDIITDELEKPFKNSHRNWYSTSLAIIGALFSIIIFVNCCRWCGCWRLLGRLCCITRNPRNGDTCPLAIRNFVNCTFDSDLRKEYRGGSRDIVTYDNRRELARIQSTSFEEDDELHEARTPLTTMTSPSKPRRSTTPM
ncbi:Integrase zinc binding domain [Popillia japonica]|uniref:RNA-directed DNA polymerase n=1 Tax=Popillia japonica TaxID=7064 RepID=A0AAW1ID33_POPJA